MQPSLTKTVGQGTAWIAMTTLFLKGIGFFFIVLVLNHLTVFEYGVAELVQTAVPLLSLLLLPGLNSTVVADMSRERGTGNLARMKGLLMSFLKVQLVFAFVAWAIVFFGAHLLAVWYGKGSTTFYFQIISFAFLLSPVRSTVQTAQSVFLAFRQQSALNILEEAWKLLLALCLFFVFDLRIAGLLLAVVLSQLLALLCIAYALYALDTSFWRTRAEAVPVFYFLYHHGKWGVFANYLGTFGKNIRPWIINVFLGPTAVGLFAVVQGLIGHVVSLVPLDTVVRPILPQYVHDKERFYTLIGKAVKYELLGYVAVSAVSAAGVPILIHLFFPQYTPAILLFQVTLFMLISSAFDAIFSGVFFALQAQRNLFWASVYKLVLVLIFMPPCIQYFGLLGIAYANIFSNSLYVWERYLKLKRLMPGFSLSLKDFITVDENDRIILRRGLRFVSTVPGFAFMAQGKDD